MKKVLKIIGVGFLASAAFSFLFNKKEKKENNINTHSDNFLSSNAISIINQNDTSDDFINIKDSAIGTIYNRHEDAAKIMTDSINNIYNGIISDYDDLGLDQVSNELDDLLSEDKR